MLPESQVEPFSFLTEVTVPTLKHGTHRMPKARHKSTRPLDRWSLHVQGLNVNYKHKNECSPIFSLEESTHCVQIGFWA